MEPELPGAAFLCLERELTQVGRSWSRHWDLGQLEPEPTQVGRSQSRLRDLGHPEQELPKKVAAPQHWF